MMRKLIAITIAALMLMAIVPSSYAESSHIKPYKGWIGADSPLYGAKVFMQKLDESITNDANEKLKKKLAHAEERLAEAQAMAVVNNAAALEAALNEYNNTMGEINETMELPEINETEYSEIAPIMDEHRTVLEDLINNSTMPEESKKGLLNAYNQSLKIKNGRPFIYYNNTSYFIPPGQLKKMSGNNTTFTVPPGLAKKGFVLPDPSELPSIINGSKAPKKQVNGNGNGNGKNNGNGNNK